VTRPLLTTKLYALPPRPESVPRPRLIERLNAGLPRQGGGFARKLTLVSAPAGYGKTTLLSEWTATTDKSVAWLPLDEGDNDPVRFWTYLAGALRQIEVDLGQGIPNALRSPQQPPIEALLTSLINHIAAFANDVVLVLDDYHLITGRRIHDALSFLLDHLPNNAHLMVATRADPPLPLARLRGRGQLTEIRQADLRFTVVEATTFLSTTFGLDLSAQELAALEERTEGWITGLQLAALSLRGRDDVSAFMPAFTLSDRCRIAGSYLAAPLWCTTADLEPPQLACGQGYRLWSSLILPTSSSGRGLSMSWGWVRNQFDARS
jgi:LuxR family maltose regulon positive regulatory protein